VVPPLAAGEVHVWFRRVARSRTEAASLLETLANDERRRAGRFRDDPDRRRYVTGRATVRTLAAAYLGVASADVHVEVGPRGKPRVAIGSQAGELYFNLSHAGGVVAVAFSRRVELGIDVELRARPVAVDTLAARVLPPDQAAALARLPAARRRGALLACWVCAEALAKARGDGVLRPLPVPLAAVTGRFRPHLVPGTGHGAAMWVLTRVPAPPGYVAALAHPTPARHVLVLPPPA
jgi:4'-phosphopantetheinyl transferase